VNLAEKMNDGAKYNGLRSMSQTRYAWLIAVFPSEEVEITIEHRRAGV